MMSGFYSAVSAMMALEEQENVTTNNMANASTTGYKSDSLTIESFDEVYVQNTKNGVTTQLGTISLGAQVSSVDTSFTQGTLTQTSTDTDFAISGRGFFVVESGDSYVYTRDGSFTVGTDGYLKTSSGDNVLGVNQDTGNIEPIYVGSYDFTLDSSGILQVDGGSNYTFLTADFEDYSTLTKTGSNYYTGDNAMYNTEVSVYQGYLEESNVDLVTEMVNMMTTMRSFESCQSVLKMIDEVAEISATQVGKV